jgi:choline dehydrogenase-like flavoprotein
MSRAARPDQTKYKTSEVVDFVVVGSGAAGGILAKELSTNGFSVVVLEQGPYIHESEFSHDEIKILQEDFLTNHPKLQPNTFRKTPKDKAKPQRALVYGRAVGGTSNHFTANFWRFHEIDFIERSKIGAVAGSTLVDWPISLRRSRAVLHQGRMGSRRFRSWPAPARSIRRAPSRIRCRRCR